MIKNTPANEGDIRDVSLCPGSGRNPEGGQHGNPFQYFLPREPHRQRSLSGYGPQDCKESDMTEMT